MIDTQVRKVMPKLVNLKSTSKYGLKMIHSHAINY